VRIKGEIKMIKTVTIEREKLKEIHRCIGDLGASRQGRELWEYLGLLISPTPTLTKEDWQRVVNERFYVRYKEGATMFLIDYRRDAGEMELVREKGLRQIHIKGHPHPDGDELVSVKLWKCIDYSMSSIRAKHVNSWDDVREYICL